MEPRRRGCGTAAAEQAGLWRELSTDWLLLELMPWSAKAWELLQHQCRPTADAALHSAEALLAAIDKAADIKGLEPARKFKVGLEGLHRFVERQPLARVHECALAVLALESEPVDPRL